MGDDIKVINGIVTGVCIGTPMQDATPVNADDNKPYFVERNVEKWELVHRWHTSYNIKE